MKKYIYKIEKRSRWSGTETLVPDNKAAVAKKLARKATEEENLAHRIQTAEQAKAEASMAARVAMTQNLPRKEVLRAAHKAARAAGQSAIPYMYDHEYVWASN